MYSNCHMTTTGMKRSPHPSPRKTKSREQARAIITNPKLLLYNRGATILGSVQLIMNTGYYSLAFAIPLTMIVLILISAWYILNRKVPNSSLWLAAYAFPNIIEKKTDENRQTTWQVKDTDLEEGSAVLSKGYSAYVFQCSNRLFKRRNPEWIGESRVLRDCLRYQQSGGCKLRCF